MMQKVCFIVNPISGAKDKSGFEALVARRLDRSRYSYEIVFTQHAGHATEIAASSDADIICAVGGDGTVDEVARGLLGRDKVMAIIPCGSGDGLALHLGISRNLRKAIGTINGGEVRKMDCGQIGGGPALAPASAGGSGAAVAGGRQMFLCTCGMGLDAIVSFRFAESATRGLRTYISKALKTWRGFRCERYDICAEGFRWSGEAAIVCVGNAGQWGNQARIAPLASTFDGKLDLTIIKPFKTIDIPGLVVKLMTGRLHTHRKVVCVQASHINIKRDSSGPFHFDGDPREYGTVADIQVKPGALKILVPKQIN